MARRAQKYRITINTEKRIASQPKMCATDGEIISNSIHRSRIAPAARAKRKRNHRLLLQKHHDPWNENERCNGQKLPSGCSASPGIPLNHLTRKKANDEAALRPG